MEETVLIGWATLIIAFPLGALAAALLYQAHRQAIEDLGHPLRVLRLQLVVEVVLTCLMLLFGLIFVNNDQVPPPLDVETTKYITRIAILLAGLIPTVMWLWIYLKPQRGSDEE